DLDVQFLDAEPARAGLGKLRDHVAKITDTLIEAKELHPGRKNSLDALCERYFVNNANRTLHGALLDARLLAECYLAMTRGQESLVMELETPAQAAAAAAGLVIDLSNLIVLPALPEEAALQRRRTVGAGFDEHFEAPASRAQAQRLAAALLGEVEEYELGERSLAFEREGGEEIDGVLAVQAPLRLDEALHVDLGHRA